GGELVVRGEGGARAVEIALLQPRLRLVEQRGRFFLPEVGDDLLRERVHRQRRERRIDGRDRVVGPVVAQLRAGGGELVLRAGHRGRDPVRFHLRDRGGLLLRRGRRGRGGRGGGLARLGNLHVDHRGTGGLARGGRGGGSRGRLRRDRDGRGRRRVLRGGGGRSGLGGGAFGGGLFAGALLLERGFLGGGLGLDLGPEPLHRGVVRRQGLELVERLARRGRVARIARAQ